MVRRSVIVSYTRNILCPVCSFQTCSRLKLARHLAMKGISPEFNDGGAHAAWRESHGWPAFYDNVPKGLIRKIKEFLDRDDKYGSLTETC